MKKRTAIRTLLPESTSLAGFGSCRSQGDRAETNVTVTQAFGTPNQIYAYAIDDFASGRGPTPNLAERGLGFPEVVRFVS